LLLLLILSAAKAASAVTEILHAVSRDLSFDDRLIVRILQCLGIVGRIHHVEIVVSSEDDRFLIGRYRCPRRLALGSFVQQLQLSAPQFVVKIELLLIARGRRSENAAASAELLLLCLFQILFFVFLLLLLGSFSRLRSRSRSLLLAWNHRLA